MAPGAGAKPLSGSSGVQANLDGMTVDRRDLSFKATETRDVNLKFDQIEARREFGDGMLDLQARVHLHERKTPAIGLIKELHRPGIVIVGGLTQTNSGFPQRLILFERESWRWRLFEDLLLAALDGAVAHSGGPGCAIVVGNDLDLDMSCVLRAVAP